MLFLQENECPVSLNSCRPVDLISGCRSLGSLVAWEEGPGPYSASAGLQEVRQSLEEVRSQLGAVEEVVGIPLEATRG